MQGGYAANTKTNTKNTQKPQNLLKFSKLQTNTKHQPFLTIKGQINTPSFSFSLI